MSWFVRAVFRLPLPLLAVDDVMGNFCALDAGGDDVEFIWMFACYQWSMVRERVRELTLSELEFEEQAKIGCAVFVRFCPASRLYRERCVCRRGTQLSSFIEMG